MQIRKSVQEDAYEFVRIKNQLPMRMANGETTTGGFLLGTNEAQYGVYIRSALCLTALSVDHIAGFGIMLPDEQLRAGELWSRRDEVQWKIDPAAYFGCRLCYFEQLAFLPGHRRLALRLAWQLIDTAFRDGAELLLTTTVLKPVRNLAPLPFIAASGGKHAGTINEVYEGTGQILSDLYIIHRNEFYARSVAHPLYFFLSEGKLRTL